MVVCAIALIALSAFVTFFITSLPGSKDKGPSTASPTPTAYVTMADPRQGAGTLEEMAPPSATPVPSEQPGEQDLNG